MQVGQRLNLFGYFSLPQLTNEQGQSGNYGLMDQIKALDWVYDNIKAFGGDPNNITVGGQSGGSHRAMAIAGFAHVERTCETGYLPKLVFMVYEICSVKRSGGSWPGVFGTNWN